MDQTVSTRSSVELRTKLAAMCVMFAGILRLIGILIVRYEGASVGGWLAILPVPILFVLGIGVYYNSRVAGGLSLLLCALLLYQNVSPWITANWSQFSLTSRSVPWLMFAGFTLLNYALAIVFLFLIQTKKAGHLIEKSQEKLSESI
jgi:hypothetical protein